MIFGIAIAIALFFIVIALFSYKNYSDRKRDIAIRTLQTQGIEPRASVLISSEVVESVGGFRRWLEDLVKYKPGLTVAQVISTCVNYIIGGLALGAIFGFLIGLTKGGLYPIGLGIVAAILGGLLGFLLPVVSLTTNRTRTKTSIAAAANLLLLLTTMKLYTGSAVQEALGYAIRAGKGLGNKLIRREWINHENLRNSPSTFIKYMAQLYDVPVFQRFSSSLSVAQSMGGDITKQLLELGEEEDRQNLKELEEELGKKANRLLFYQMAIFVAIIANVVVLAGYALLNGLKTF
jgi:Flp pilus assembly protein TadB